MSAVRQMVAAATVLALAGAVAGCGARGGGGSGGASVAKGDAIVIGTQVPLTGPASFVGQGFQVGAELAMNEINANGGINGRNLNLKFVDDRGTPDGGVAAVRELVDRDQVLGVLSGSTSSATVAAIPYVSSNKALYYASLASDPQVLKDFHQNIFAGATINQKDGVKAYVTYLKKQGFRSVAIMECDQAHCTSGTPLLQAALKAAGIEVTATATYTSGDTDFTGQIAQVGKSKPEAVFIYGLAADGGRIIPQLRRAGVNVPLVGDTSLADPSVATVAGSAAEGFTTFWLGGTQFLSDNTGAMANWLQSLNNRVKDQPNGTPNLYSMMAYSDVYVLAEAIRESGDNVTKDAVIGNLEKMSGFVAGKGGKWDFAEPVAVPRSFTTNDHQGNRTVTPISVTDGKFTTLPGVG